MAALTLSEVKTHLNLTTTTQDGELTAFIARSEAAVAARCGPIEPTVTSQRVRGGRPLLSVDVTPIVSLTSVTPVGGSALDVSLMVVDESAGVIEHESGGSFGSRWYDVVYVAGRTDVPEDLRLGVLELVRHLWDTQRAPSGGRIGTGQDSAANTIPGAHLIFPFRVEQLIAPHVQVAI